MELSVSVEGASESGSDMSSIEAAIHESKFPYYFNEWLKNVNFLLLKMDRVTIFSLTSMVNLSTFYIWRDKMMEHCVFELLNHEILDNKID